MITSDFGSNYENFLILEFQKVCCIFEKNRYKYLNTTNLLSSKTNEQM